MSEITNTTKGAKENPAGFLMDAMAMGSSNAILLQEAQGQSEFVNSTVLPVKFLYSTKEELEKAGVKFGNICKDDPLFQEAELPVGWTKKASDHSMWSELLDNKGRQRAAIFYKAAFYDRKAHISLKPRFTVSGYDHDDKAVVLDGETEIYEVSFIEADSSSREIAIDTCETWLAEKYPDHEDVTAYWNE